MTSVDPLVRFERKLHCARGPGSVQGTSPRIGHLEGNWGRRDSGEAAFWDLRLPPIANFQDPCFRTEYGMTGNGIAIGIECKPSFGRLRCAEQLREIFVLIGSDVVDPGASRGVPALFHGGA